MVALALQLASVERPDDDHGSFFHPIKLNKRHVANSISGFLSSDLQAGVSYTEAAFFDLLLSSLFFLCTISVFFFLDKLVPSRG